MANKRINYRYKIRSLDLEYNKHGFAPVFCDIESADWGCIQWDRFGSGGNAHNRHMFVDDWRLEHLWRRFEQGLMKICMFDFVTAPDFSIESHFPAPLVSYQIWRMSSIAQYWLSFGVNVVPVLQWGSPDLFHLCSVGIVKNSVVAVRGPQKGTEDDWIQGAQYMRKKIKPSLVLHFGRKIEGVFDNVVFHTLKLKKTNTAI